jgi:hypothetical protein
MKTIVNYQIFGKESKDFDFVMSDWDITRRKINRNIFRNVVLMLLLLINVQSAFIFYRIVETISA